MIMRMLVPIVPLALALAACGGAGAALDVTETDLSTGIGGPSTNGPAARSTPTGTVSRIDLDDLIAKGPGPLLAMVQTEPKRMNGRFVGFTIVAFPVGPPETVDLRPGDVVVAINGRKIERPEHYFEVFEALKTAEEIRFELYQQGENRILVYPISP